MSKIMRAKTPYSPLSADEILAKIAVGREQNDSGMGIPFDDAMKDMRSLACSEEMGDGKCPS